MPQRGVDRVPAEALDRDLVGAQLARVEQPEQLDRAEVALAQRAVLLGAVLADVPRVARALLALRRQREHVRGRDVGDAVAADQLADAGEHGVGVLDVLDRLQEHDAVDVARPTARSCCARSAASAPSTSAARARRPRGWRRRRPPRWRARRARPSRSPRRRRGRPPCGRRPARRSSGRRPGGAGTSSSPPARRGACARRSAAGAGRRAAGRAGGRARARRARTLAARARRDGCYERVSFGNLPARIV